ncbi:UNVERIFIED_CONTAM: ABC transporter ATP-binding protein [Streptococcus canis]|uniref:ABC transporter ATP-binding protein n=1 Tax=Streptococcus canis TaxID=1329 RepID=UPI000B8B0291|nr:ABC transporter ATP-binding protein [Streptococcus canis]QJD12929.1 ABC transporter ATP-binding protein [Streptococcus canis]GFG48211.1 ABC transporter ATP-binding protein [Streptococcus canis]VTR80592.1 ABC transporter family protein [Streptococcus canis]
MSKNSSHIKVQNLSFAYGGNLVLDNLTFSIPKGKITTIMGANGSGKSTLLQLLTKNLPLKQGQVWLEQEALATISLKAFAKKVAVVHQYHQVAEGLLVGELVAMARLARRSFFRTTTKEDEERLAWALEVTALSDYVYRDIQHLSGGEQQRVWIAMALAQETDIIFLDEPTTYLDIKYQLDILKLIAKINQELGLTIVLVLHDINQALSLSDHLIGLKDGRLYAQGQPRELLDQQFIGDVFGVELPFVEKNGQQFVLTSLVNETNDTRSQRRDRNKNR